MAAAAPCKVRDTDSICPPTIVSLSHSSVVSFSYPAAVSSSYAAAVSSSPPPTSPSCHPICHHLIIALPGHPVFLPHCRHLALPSSCSSALYNCPIITSFTYPIIVLLTCPIDLSLAQTSCSLIFHLPTAPVSLSRSLSLLLCRLPAPCHPDCSPCCHLVCPPHCCLAVKTSCELPLCGEYFGERGGCRLVRKTSTPLDSRIKRFLSESWTTALYIQARG